LKSTQIIIITFALIFYSPNAFSQASGAYSKEDIPEKLIERLDKQNIPEADSTAVYFNGMFQKLTEPEQDMILDLLNYTERRGKANQIIGEADITEPETGDTINFNKTLLYGILETSEAFRNKSYNLFNEWLNMAHRLTKDQGTTVTDFINFITRTGLLHEGFIYKSRLIRWEIDSDNYSFDYDENSQQFTIQILNTNLRSIYDKTDTMSIQSASLRFNPLEDNAYGTAGTVRWDKRHGPEFKDSYAKLGDYTLNLKSSSYEADSVAYYNSKILRGAITGQFKDAASPWSAKTKLRPYFNSYDKNVELLASEKNFKYFGGLTIEGNKLMITGEPKTPAVLQYYQEGRLFFEAEALQLEFYGANDAAVKIFVNDNDSIYHPSSAFIISNEHFMVSRNKSEIGRLNFQITDIKMETNMESIIRKAGNDTLKFSYANLNEAGRHQSRLPIESYLQKELSKPTKTVFRSMNYFDPQEFDKLKMYESRNPLFDIRNYCTKYNTHSFTANELASFLKKNPGEINKRLIMLWYDGYIEYNIDTERAVVNQKLFDHLDYFTRKKDYDIIQIVSPGEEGNWQVLQAGYHLKQNTLIIHGAESVILSNKNRTAFRTGSTKKVVVEENRNMQFSGLFQSGLAKFTQGYYRFNYDDYTVAIDSAKKLFYSEVRQIGEKDFKVEPIYSTVEDVEGIIYIDSSQNKSGYFIDTGYEYPKFKSTKKSYVYYNEEGITSFNPEEFYFEVYPYTRKDLMYISNKDLMLKGKMYTGNMLPIFEDTLTIQYDKFKDKEGAESEIASLGFIHDLEGENVPIFEKGKLNKNAEGKSLVRLSRAGMKGEGKIDWLTSEMQAEEFTFYSDSLYAQAADFKISESNDDERYPILSAENVKIKWDVEKESITCISAEEEQMDIYDGRVKMSGEARYTPDYLMGKGTAEYENSRLESDSIMFKENAFFASKGNYAAYEKGSDNTKLLFATESMKSYTDMIAGKTAFEKADSTSYANIESNKFNSYPNYMLWDHEETEAEINKPLNTHSNPALSSGEQLLDSAYMVDVADFSPGSFYGSTDSLQLISKTDGLVFYGENADFDGSAKNLTIQEVKRIMVADISVIPASELVIQENGKFGELKNTKIEVINDSNMVTHEITDVDIEIQGKNSYTASSGTYKYRDITGNDQNVFFSSIRYDELKKASVATGSVDEAREFMLSPYYYFKGDINFNAGSDYLYFNGYAKMKDFCNYTPDWFYFKNEINPKDVTIELNSDLQSDSAKQYGRVFADIKFARDSNYIIPAFLKTAPGTRDQSVFSGRKDGYVTKYQANEKQYIVASAENLKDTLPLKNYMSYETDNCLIRTYGDLNYANIPYTDFTAIGKSEYDIRSRRYRIESFSILDFFFNDEASAIMADRIINQLPSAPVLFDDVLKNKMQRIAGKDIVKEYTQNQLSQTVLPKPLDSRFVFSELKFYWDEEQGAFKSSGESELLAINGISVNQKIKTKVKITKGFRNDEVRILIKVDNNDWFYFRFFDTNLYAFSSLSEFNQAINNTKTSSRKDPDSRLRYILANENEARAFDDSF
jgi:hypothetical protein